MVPSLALAAAIWALSGAGAAAQSIESMLKDFGLLGAPLAPDCTQKPSPSNWYGRYSITKAGEGRLVYDSGTSGENVYMIRGAEMLAPDRLLMLQEFVRSHRFITLVMVKADDKFRTLTARRADGTFQVQDGKFSDGGRESPWLSRCQ
jgi:hypothetical protein